MNFILSKAVRKIYYLCSGAALYISSGEGIEASSMKYKRKTNDGKITYLVNRPRSDMSEE